MTGVEVKNTNNAKAINYNRIKEGAFFTFKDRSGLMLKLRNDEVYDLICRYKITNFSLSMIYPDYIVLNKVNIEVDF